MLTVEERLWSKTEKKDTGCIEWTACKTKDGYGKFWFEGKTDRAHIVSFFLKNGFRPPAVMHKCDNPPCIRPSHLKAGTVAENNADMLRKGRLNKTGLALGTAASKRKRESNLSSAF